MQKLSLLQGDKINFELDGEDYITEAWTDLELTSNSLIVINNTLCCTGI